MILIEELLLFSERAWFSRRLRKTSSIANP